jgi:hypothetical protein
MRPVDKEDLEINKKEREPAQVLREAAAHELFDYYRKRWEKEHKGALVIRSLNEAQASIRDVLRACQGDKQLVITMLDIFFTKPNQYYKNMAHSLEVFKADMQQLAAAAKQKIANGNEAVMIRVQVWTSCPKCFESFQTECRAIDIERVQDSAPCQRCRA